VRIAHGQVFARDFFEVVGPGTFYWLAPVLQALRHNVVATRICLFVTSLGTALAMYFLSRRICEQYQVLPSILLAGTYFGSSWPAISHHVDSNCFALLAVACMIVWQDNVRGFYCLPPVRWREPQRAVFNPRGCCCCLPCWCGFGCSTGGNQPRCHGYGQWLEAMVA